MVTVQLPMDPETPVLKTEAVGWCDDEFLRQFEACTLPYLHWTHRAHLRVAYIYLTRLGLDGAVPKVTAGIRAYNQSQGIVDTPDSGYHETMTVAWLHLVAAMLALYGPDGSGVAATPAVNGAESSKLSPAERFLENQPQLREKKLLRLFYSRERFCSPEAKYHFVPPDLTPFPKIRQSGLPSLSSGE
jgi:hypothetical protein